MKHRLGSFLAGAATFALAASLTFSALAISGRMTIEVDPINVQVNGEVFAPTDVNGEAVPIFAYNGTTYAPLRALAEAYGLEVGYDAGSNMATVGKADAKTTATPEPTTAPDTTVKSDYSDWSAEDEAIYLELIRGWTYTYTGAVRSWGNEIDRAVYSAEPKSDDVTFDWESFEKSDSFKKICIRLADEVNTSDKPYTSISYPGSPKGVTVSVIGEDVGTF